MPKIIVKDHKYYFKVRGLGGPKGDKGDTGPAGPQGPQGPYVNVVAGTTTTLPAGSSAQVKVNNTGNTSTLNFGIPQGAKGDKGDAGTPGAQGPRGFAATVNVGETTTSQPGTDASVVNAGNEHDAVLKFTIPRGEKGETGETGPQGPTGGVKSTVVAELPETGESDKYYLVNRTAEGGTIATADGYAQIENDENAGDLTASQLLGNAEQTTYSGKNLCPNPLEYGIYNENGAKSGSDTGSVRSTTQLKVAPSTQYIFSCNGAKINTWLYEYDADGTYISGTRRLISQTAFTTGSTTHFVTFFKGSDTGLTGYQLEQGNQVTSYEPFVGGIPAPNPDFPQPISTVTGENVVKVVGKNLFSGDFSQFDSVGGDGILYSYFELPTDGDYELTLVAKNEMSTQSTSRYIGFSSTGGGAPGGHILWAYSGTASSTAGQTRSIPNYVAGGGKLKYMTLYPKNQATLEWFTENFDIQLELGSTATAYEPYQGQEFPIDLGSIELAKVGTYQDRIYKSDGKWYIEKQVGKVVLDGSESWTAQASNTGYMYRLYHVGVGSIASSSMSNLMSDYFTPTTGANIYNVTSGGYMAQLTVVDYIRFNIGDTTNKLGDFKTWLASNKPTVYYALATPTTTEITDETLRAQLNFLASLYKGENNISLVGTGAQGEFTGNYVVYDKYNRHKVYIWSSDDNTWQIILQ